MLQKIQGLVQCAPQEGLGPEHLAVMADNEEASERDPV